MHSFVLRAGIVALCLAPAAALAQNVATLGDVKVTADEVRQLAHLQPQLKQRILGSEKGLESLVQDELIRRALFGEATAEGWDKRPGVARAAELAREREIIASYLDGLAQPPAGYPDEATVRKFYDANKAQISLPPRHHLAQIFVARPAAANDADGAAKRAADLARRARERGADFAALAKAESADPASRDKGGDLGWYAEASMLPAVRAAVQSMKPGETSDPIATPGGWHVVRLIDFRPQAPATFDESRAALAQNLRARKVSQLKQAHIDAMLRKTPPKIDSGALASLREGLK